MVLLSENIETSYDKFKYQNISVFLDPSVTMEAFNRPLVCHMTSKFLCPCVDGPFSLGRQEMQNRVQLYRQALINMVTNVN